MAAIDLYRVQFTYKELGHNVAVHSSLQICSQTIHGRTRSNLNLMYNFTPWQKNFQLRKGMTAHLGWWYVKVLETAIHFSKTVQATVSKLTALAHIKWQQVCQQCHNCASTVIGKLPTFGNIQMLQRGCQITADMLKGSTITSCSSNLQHCETTQPFCLWFHAFGGDAVTVVEFQHR